MRVHRILTVAALAAMLALTGCGGDKGGPGGGGGVPGGGGTPDGGGGGASEWAITDLCAQSNLDPMRALFPVVKDFESDSKKESGYTGYHCDGLAGLTDDYTGVGFLSLTAYVYEDPARAAGAYTYYGDEPPQEVADLGQEARLTHEGDYMVQVEVLDGALFFVVTWSPNGPGLPDGIGEALVETARATLANLHT